MPIKVTRTLLTAALDGSLRNAKFRTDPYFGFSVPTSAAGHRAASALSVQDLAEQVRVRRDRAQAGRACSRRTSCSSRPTSMPTCAPRAGSADRRRVTLADAGGFHGRGGTRCSRGELLSRSARTGSTGARSRSSSPSCRSSIRIIICGTAAAGAICSTTCSPTPTAATTSWRPCSCRRARCIAPTGPEEMKPVGETEFVNGVAAMTASGIYGKIRACAGIVGHADLMLGSRVEPVLEAHDARRRRALPRHPPHRRLGRRPAVRNPALSVAARHAGRREIPRRLRGAAPARATRSMPGCIIRRSTS